MVRENLQPSNSLAVRAMKKAGRCSRSRRASRTASSAPSPSPRSRRSHGGFARFRAARNRARRAPHGIGAGARQPLRPVPAKKQTEELLRASERAFAISRIFRRTFSGRPTRSTASRASCTGRATARRSSAAASSARRRGACLGEAGPGGLGGAHAMLNSHPPASATSSSRA